jgi:hypothetical protein
MDPQVKDEKKDEKIVKNHYYLAEKIMQENRMSIRGYEAFECYKHNPERGLKAFEHYKLAAKNGNPDAQFIVGCMFGEKHGMQLLGYVIDNPDDRIAIAHYKVAALKGHVDAMYNLGQYAENDGKLSDAIKWYGKVEKICGKNHAASYRIASICVQMALKRMRALSTPPNECSNRLSMLCQKKKTHLEEFLEQK